MKDINVKRLLERLKHLRSRDRIFEKGLQVAMNRSDGSEFHSALTPFASIIVSQILEKISIPDSWICNDKKPQSFPLVAFPNRINELIETTEEVVSLYSL